MGEQQPDQGGVRCVVVTSLPPGGLYFIDQLGRAGQVETVIWQRPPARSPLRRLADALYGLLRRSARPSVDEHDLSQLLPGFAGEHRTDRRPGRRLRELARRHHLRVLATTDINQDQAVGRLLAESACPYALVLGGRVIKAAVLQAFRGVWINGHGGVLPWYRGLFSEYWALTEGDVDNLGATIHVLTERIDAGDILRVSRVAFDPQETLRSLCRRNHANLIQAYLAAVRDLQGAALPLSRAPAAVLPGRYFRYPEGDLQAILDRGVRQICRPKPMSGSSSPPQVG